MNHAFARTSTLFLLTASAFAVQAQSAAGITQNEGESVKSIYTAPVSGLPIRFDNGIFVYGAAQIGAGHDSNVRASEDDVRSSSTLSLRPNVVGELKRGANRYTLSYLGDYTQYSRDKDYNYNHHTITLAADQYFTARSRLGLAFDLVDRTDGPSDTVEQSDKPDRWNSTNLRGLYVYGADGAKGRVEFEGSMQSKRYQNNLALTRGSDINANGLSGRFFWRVMPNTYATFELRRFDNDYRLATSTNDNIDTRALVGVTWDITRITSGTIKVGQQNKNYSQRDDVKRGTYEAQIQWSPRTYSTFTLNASRSQEDAADVSTSTANKRHSLRWNHAWSESLSSNVGLSKANATFANSGRQDATTSASVGLSYQVRSNLGLALDFTRAKRDSNTAGFNYKRNTVFASVQVAL